MTRRSSAEYAAGDEQYLDAPPAGSSDGVKHRCLGPVVVRDGPIVVECQNAEFHMADSEHCKLHDSRRALQKLPRRDVAGHSQ